MVVAETLSPGLRSSPRIRWYPHRGFSRPRRRMRSVVPGSRGGLPALAFLRNVHFLLTSSRCHRSRVSGRMTNDDHRALGRARLAATRKTRSSRRSRGRLTFRRSTFTWWRRISISRSDRAGDRPQECAGRTDRGATRAWVSFPRGESACYRRSMGRESGFLNPSRDGETSQVWSVPPAGHCLSRTRLRVVRTLLSALIGRGDLTGTGRRPALQVTAPRPKTTSPTRRAR